MKLRIPTGEDVGFQMAPMIDIVFQLMIFFMCAAHVHQTFDNRTIEVPIATHSTVPKEAPDRRFVTVEADGEIYLNGVHVTVGVLKEEIEKARRIVPDLKIFLRGDKRVEHKYIKKVMQACAEAGVGDIIFAAYQSEAK